MKKNVFLFTCFVALSATILSAQEPTTKDTTTIEEKKDSIPNPWSKGLVTTATFSQTSLSNWAAGGQNALSLNLYGKVFLNYKKNKHSWENSLELAYGLLKQESNNIQKSDDKFDFLAKYNRQFKEGKLSMSTFLNFKSQIANGYVYSGDNNELTDLISRFAAPAFLFTTIGIEYKPKSFFSIYFSPLTNKNTIVLKDDNIDETDYGVDTGQTWRFEGGTLARLYLKKEALKNVNIESKAEFFTNYVEGFGNIDVNWENAIVMQVNKYLSTNFFTHMIYDDDVNIVDASEASNPNARGGPRLQFKQVFGLGLTYKL